MGYRIQNTEDVTAFVAVAAAVDVSISSAIAAAVVGRSP